MPVPTKVNIAHYRGDTLVIQLTLWGDAAHTIPADLSTATARAQVRAEQDSGTVAATFDCLIAGQTVTATLPPAQARLLPALGYWDIEIDYFSDDTVVTTVAAGALSAGPDVTRAVA